MNVNNIYAWNRGITVKRGSSATQETRTIKRGNRIVKKTIIRDMNGNRIGTISVSQPLKKTKRLQYNFKKISNRILAAKSSGTARKALMTAKEVTASLRRKLRCGEYDDKELENAIIHAERMERVAQKKMKHLKEEEKAKRQQGPCSAEMEEEELEPIVEESEEEQDSGLSEEELRAFMQELKDMVEESSDLLEDIAESDELTEELVGTLREDMDPADLEQLKKKHRAEEMREIIEADMKYLKAVFEKLAKEKQQASSGVSAHRSENSYNGGVALEIGGMDMAVAEAEPVDVPEGGNVDVSV